MMRRSGSHLHDKTSINQYLSNMINYRLACNIALHHSVYYTGFCCNFRCPKRI